MAATALKLDSASVRLHVGTSDFTLTTPPGGFQVPDLTDPTAPRSARLKLEVHKSYEEGINMGTPAGFLADLETLLGPAIQGIPAGQTLAAQWTDFLAQVRQVPVLNQLTDAALNTTILITDIVIDAAFSSPAGGGAGSGTFSGTFSLGLMFVPRQADRPTLFTASLVAFGGTMTVQIAGNANAGVLGFAWP